MYYPVKLILINYVPNELRKGLLFASTLFPNTEKQRMEVWAHESRTHLSATEFFEIHGFPVEMKLLTEEGLEIASGEQLAWWDDNDSSSENLKDMTLNEVNTILNDYEGVVDILIDEDYYSLGNVVPLIAMDKVVLRFHCEECDEVPDNEISEEEDEY